MVADSKRMGLLPNTLGERIALILVACAMAFTGGFLYLRLADVPAKEIAQPSLVDVAPAGTLFGSDLRPAVQLGRLFTPMAQPHRQLTITQMPVSNHNLRPLSAQPIAIVMHATGSGKPGSEYASLAKLRKRFDGDVEVSAHYGVDRKGRVAQYVPDALRAWHTAAPGWNDYSIGIELLNDNSGVQPYPPAQLESTRLLVQALSAQYQIPMEFVVRHGDVQPWDRRDPVAFPWRDFRKSLRVSSPTT